MNWTALRFWMMRQSNGCSTPVQRSSAAKQWFQELAQTTKKPQKWRKQIHHTLFHRESSFAFYALNAWLISLWNRGIPVSGDRGVPHSQVHPCPHSRVRPCPHSRVRVLTYGYAPDRGIPVSGNRGIPVQPVTESCFRLLYRTNLFLFKRSMFMQNKEVLWKYPVRLISRNYRSLVVTRHQWTGYQPECCIFTMQLLMAWRKSDCSTHWKQLLASDTWSNFNVCVAEVRRSMCFVKEGWREHRFCVDWGKLWSGSQDMLERFSVLCFTILSHLIPDERGMIEMVNELCWLGCWLKHRLHANWRYDAGLPDWPFHLCMANFEKFGHFLNALAMKNHTWPFYEIWPFFQFLHYNEIVNKYYVVFCIFWRDFMSVLQQHHGTSTLYCFEVRSNDLTLAASWFCTNVSVSDSLMDTVGSCYTCNWRLLHSVVWLIMF